MSGGKAHGRNRQYQVECRDVLMCRDPGLRPWEGDGIDVPFTFAGTGWSLDVALRDPSGGLIVVECRRKAGAVKQDEVFCFASKVQRLRETLKIPVKGLMIAKTDQQIGAVKVGQSAGIEVMVLPEGSAPSGFSMTSLRYHAERNIKCRDLGVHIPPESLKLTGLAPAVVIR